MDIVLHDYESLVLKRIAFLSMLSCACSEHLGDVVVVVVVVVVGASRRLGSPQAPSEIQRAMYKQKMATFW